MATAFITYLRWSSRGSLAINEAVPKNREIIPKQDGL